MDQTIPVLGKQGPKHRQITDSLRQSILAGEFTPGTRLPTMHNLAEQFNTSYFTVHSALTPLVREGLLERKRRLGTVVRGGTVRLTCAGIYYGRDFWSESAMAFYKNVQVALQTLLSEGHVDSRLWVDHRNESDRPGPLPDLLRAAERRQIQCLIVVLTNTADLQWLRQLPVPIVFLTSGEMPNKVSGDVKQMFRAVMGRLRQQGYRKVGLISPGQRSLPQDATRGRYAPFYQEYFSAVAEFGLETEKDWFRAPREVVPCEEFEWYGYQQFRALWALPRRPEALVVYPDLTVRGTVTAVLEERVRVPEELKLVLHRNEQVKLLCPFPALWMVFSEREVARALFQQVRALVAGRPVRPIYLPLKVRETTSVVSRTESTEEIRKGKLHK